MIDLKQLPTSGIVQYICAMKNAHQNHIEMIVKQGSTQFINYDDLDNDEQDQCLAFQ